MLDEDEFGFSEDGIITSPHTQLMIAQYNQHMKTKMDEKMKENCYKSVPQVLKVRVLAPLPTSPDTEDYPMVENLQTILKLMKCSDNSLQLFDNQGNLVEIEDLTTTITNENIGKYMTITNNPPNNNSKFCEMIVAVPVKMKKPLQTIKDDPKIQLMGTLQASNIWMNEMKHNYLLTRRSGVLVEAAPFLVHIQNFEADLQEAISNAMTMTMIQKITEEESWRTNGKEASPQYISEMIEVKKAKCTHQKGKPGQMVTNFLEIHVPKQYTGLFKNLLCTVSTSTAWKKRFGKFAHTGMVTRTGVEIIQKIYRRQIQYHQQITRIPLFIPDTEYKTDEGLTVIETLTKQAFVQSVEPTYDKAKKGKHFVIVKHSNKGNLLHYINNKLIPTIRPSAVNGAPYIDELYKQDKSPAERVEAQFIAWEDGPQPRDPPTIQRETFGVKHVMFPSRFAAGASTAPAPLPPPPAPNLPQPTKPPNAWSKQPQKPPGNAWTNQLYDNRSLEDTVDETNTMSDLQSNFSRMDAELKALRAEQAEHTRNLANMMDTLMNRIADMMAGRLTNTTPTPHITPLTQIVTQTQSTNTTNNASQTQSEANPVSQTSTPETTLITGTHFPQKLPMEEATPTVIQQAVAPNRTPPSRDSPKKKRPKSDTDKIIIDTQ